MQNPADTGHLSCTSNSNHSAAILGTATAATQCELTEMVCDEHAIAVR
jgi:hypothetical protein